MLARFTTKELKWIWLMGAVGALTRVALAFRSPAHLATRPYIEDAFYTLTCARQLALGNGFSVDGIHPTNGVQPLLALLYAPFFWLCGDRWSALQSTFVLQAVLQVAGMVLIALLVKRLTSDQPATRYSPPIVAAAIWTFSAQLFIHNTNGLETGLVAVLLLWITVLFTSELVWRRTILVGILSGLLILARIDCAIFVAILCIWLALRYPKKLRRWFSIAAIAIAVSAPWFVYGLVEFGRLMPISGQSEAAHALQATTILDNIWEALVALADVATVFFYHQLSAVPQWLNAVWVIAVAAAVWLISRKTHIVQSIQARGPLRVLTPLTLFGVFVLLYYTLFFSAPHFLARYLQPVRVLYVILISLAAPILLSLTRHSKSLQTLVLAVGLVAMGFAAERYVNCFTTDAISDLYKAGVWGTEHPESHIGMEQSGTAGFVADNVSNLDGKVNAEALHAIQAGTMGKYVGQFEYVADWPELMAPTLREAEARGIGFEPIDTLGRVVVYQRR